MEGRKVKPRIELISKRIDSTKTQKGLVKKFNPMVSLKSKAKRSSKRKSAATQNQGQRKRLGSQKKKKDADLFSHVSLVLPV